MWLAHRGIAVSVDVPIAKADVIGIFVDGIPRGIGQWALDAIPIEQIEELRFFPAEQAVTRFGSSNPFGAIEITLKR